VWGDEAAIADRVQAQRDAGADHVCIQVLTDPPQDLAQAMSGWRQLAQVFGA
jgi:2-methylisocitrate lyase-like PEP mutase family enzyme